MADGYSSKCCHCASSIGDDVQVHPQFVTDAKDASKVEVYCPRCFVWWRMRQEPERFQAHQACVARCQFCHWTMVSFGARPGGSLLCFHCHSTGAVPIEPRPEDLVAMNEVIQAARDEIRVKRRST